MNVTRIVVLAVAAIAAGAAAFLVRGILGGGTADVEASAPLPQIEVSDVLVASARIEPGRKIAAGDVRWDKWPSAAVSAGMVTQSANPDLATFVDGAVTRAPLLPGEPLTEEKIVRTDSAGFMAATIAPGRRAVSIPITAESGAGGFILPNDRVDVILTRNLGDEAVGEYGSDIILHDVRVLAINQMPRQPEDGQDALVGQTATLELSPAQAELIAQAQASGILSLALRGLGDMTIAGGGGGSIFGNDRAGTVTVLRYGITRGVESNLVTGGARGGAVSGVGGGAADIGNAVAGSIRIQR